MYQTSKEKSVIQVEVAQQHVGTEHVYRTGHGPIEEDEKSKKIICKLLNIIS